jgi:hypothetical protein
MVSIAPVHLRPRHEYIDGLYRKNEYIDGNVYSSLFPSDCCTKVVHSYQSVTTNRLTIFFRSVKHYDSSLDISNLEISLVQCLLNKTNVYFGTQLTHDASNELSLLPEISL